MRIIFRGCCKGIGTITQVNLAEEKMNEQISRESVIVDPEPGIPPVDISLEPEETFQMDD